LINSYWWYLELILSSDLEESIVWKFNECGIKNIAIEKTMPYFGFSILKVWLPSNDFKENDLDNLSQSIIELGNVFNIKIDRPLWKKIKDQDWNIVWKRFWKPDIIGNKLLVLPAWLDPPDQYLNRNIIRIDPGSAFGTGSHQTTRLCLEYIENIKLDGLSILDIGCGSGILSLAALSLGAEKVVALDNDSLAISSAKNNFELNNINILKNNILHGSIDVLVSKSNLEEFDLIFCNILPNIIIEMAPRFHEIVTSKGRAILSGINVNQYNDVLKVFHFYGWRLISKKEKGSWIALDLINFANP
tara:strand:+ start:3144 stop:4052 length:909 start_codon:yes stop_codon:yes gene_type:complete